MAIEPVMAPGLAIDAEREATRIVEAVRVQILKTLRRRGAVLGLSGGIDSSVCAALCVRALGPERVVGLLMPETDSAGESLVLARRLAERLGIRAITEDITSILLAAGCYARRDAAIREVIPEYGPGYKCKLVVSGGAERDAYHIFSIVVESPAGARKRARLTADAYLAIVAASNFKQRTRKMLEYHYADRFQYAVVGTPNRLEYDQGFFVKNGDGAADLKPIAHLYKTQVYAMARGLEIPDEIRQRRPTTDTYSLDQSQEEFFFSLPFEQLDVCVFAVNHDLSCEMAARATGLSEEQVARVYKDIAGKRVTTRYLHAPPLLVEPVLPHE